MSPTGTGAKIYFLYNKKVIPTFKRLFGTTINKGGKKVPRTGREFKKGSGKHAPGIEIYRCSRHFAFTKRQLENVPAEMQPISIADLKWIIKTAGPKLDGSGPEKEKGKSRKNTRSHKAWHFGGNLVLEGKSFKEMDEALRNHSDPAILQWYHEKGLKLNKRELHHIYDKYKYRREEHPRKSVICYQWGP